MSLLEDLALSLAVPLSDIRLLVTTAPRRYKSFEIPKRRGGSRIIAQPSRELKRLQYLLMEGALSKLPVHPAAAAYRAGRNIADNARIHRRSRVILKLDFVDFFPSLTLRDWQRYVGNAPPELFPRQDLVLYERILFWGRGTYEPVCLSIGAPSSPLLSNILMYNLDEQIYRAVHPLDVKYSRYADDITLSANNLEILIEAEKRTSRIILSSQSPRLRFNDEKRGIYRRGQRQMVTGIIITPTQDISLGRERKRLISSCIHRVATGISSAQHRQYTTGLLAFARSVEPEFIGRMIQKYGRAVVGSLIRID